MKRALSMVVALGLVTPMVSLRAQPAVTPEVVIRGLVMAMVGADAAAFEKLTLPDPRRAVLVSGGRGNQDRLRQLREDPGLVQIKQKRPFESKGVELKPDPKGAYPVGTTGLYVVAFGGEPVVMRLVRTADGWKADPRWWIAMTDLMKGVESKPGTPDYAARALSAAMIRLDRREAAKYVTAGANIDQLFAGAPRQREPSGVLDALVMEMPLVKLGPGEFVHTPTGKVVEGTAADDQVVLLGLFGVVEVPYVIRRVGNEWRVQPEPYFMLFEQ
jgi:hypothetical protein